MTSRADAAQRRASEVRSRRDRPSQRRSDDHEAAGRPWVRSTAVVHLRDADASDDMLTFSGVASVTETPYEMYDAFGPYSEVIDAGAFDATLAQEGLDVPLVLGHDQMRRIARTTNDTLTLSVTDEGLQVDARLDPDDPDVAYVAGKLRSGLLDEMSFGFRIDAGQWSPDYSEYRITRVDLHRGDVSIVGWGANPHTSAGMRSAAPVDLRALLACRTATH